MPPVRAAAAPVQELDGGDDEAKTEAGEEEEELDEEEQRKQRLRERMARLAGGQGAGPFNPFGAPPPTPAAAKKRPTKETPAPDERGVSSPPQQMVAIPGMGGMPRVQALDPDATQKVVRRETAPEQDAEVDGEDNEPLPPPRRSTAEDRSAPPPILRGKSPRKPVLSKCKSVAVLWRSSSSLGTSVRSNGLDGHESAAGVEKVCSMLRALKREQSYYEHILPSIATRRFALTY